jgi:hypothetical protein
LFPHVALKIRRSSAHCRTTLLDREAAHVSTRHAVWRLIVQLPPKQRATIVLRFYEDLDDFAIADFWVFYGPVDQALFRSLVSGFAPIADADPRNWPNSPFE